MNKDLKFLLKRAFDAGTMYEATLSEECSFNEFIKYVENQQLSICDVSQQREPLIAFLEMNNWFSLEDRKNAEGVVDCYLKAINCG